MQEKNNKKCPYIKGISIINPDDVEREYLMFCVDYAIQNDFNHIQITGPIHDSVKGNIDGMVFYKKYAIFNDEKDEAVIEAEKMLKEIKALEKEIDKDNYQKLYLKFRNLDYVAKLWKELAYILHHYVKYFETGNPAFE